MILQIQKGRSVRQFPHPYFENAKLFCVFAQRNIETADSSC